MPKVALYNIAGEQVGEMELKDEVFGLEVNEALLHEVVTMQLANRRQGTQSTKTRGEVRGGGRKPWRQKGTGRARAGSIRSPLWPGGGIIFGPKPRSFNYSMPKKKRRLAIKTALSSKVQSGEIIVLEGLEFASPKTKEMAAILNNLNATRKALIVIPENNENIYKSARNIEGVNTVAAQNINVYDILAHDKLVITKEAVEKVEEVFA
jgi:large subunit ribosomal protein L4